MSPLVVVLIVLFGVPLVVGVGATLITPSVHVWALVTGKYRKAPADR